VKSVEILFVILNLTAFAFFGIDKLISKQGGWRISEKILLVLSLFGGVGAFLGMKLFRHKTQKPLFKLLVPVFVIINALVFVILMRI
jgi:uncharacterized membrane protein YsdA (DUF1294 family)